MVSMNIFRILGDVCHALSKCILIYAIHSNSSAEGVSLITQALYCLVFLSRYTDYFSAFGYSWWNTTWKTFYILSSFYVLFIMMRIYARTREREKAWKFGAACLIGSAVLAPICMLIFRKKAGDQLSWGWIELFWIFSIILESVCVLPQLLLLRQTTVPTVLDSFYLLTLGSYRALYILNWIVREFDTNGRKPDAISIIFGVIQTAFYIDFAWVYYSRQRVKLRHGGLVDSDDLRQGWILRRVFGHKAVAGSIDDEADEESAPALGANGEPTPGRGTKWGTRGISVQADDGVLEAERERQGRSGYPGQENGVIDTADEGMEDAQLRDPDELMLDSDDDDGTLPSAGVDGVKNGSEWREGQK